MRTDGFLRAPIRGDHRRIANITLGDVALAAIPPDAVFPQTLELAFDVNAGVTEVQIAPVWPGTLRFFADAPGSNPTDPAQATQTT